MEEEAEKREKSDRQNEGEKRRRRLTRERKSRGKMKEKWSRRLTIESKSIGKMKEINGAEG